MGETKGRRASHFPFSKEPAAFDSVPMLIPPQSPGPCPRHSRGHRHTLLTGFSSPKSRTASLRQPPMLNNSHRPAVFQEHSQSRSGAPCEDCPPINPWHPQLSPNPYNKDLFSPWNIPSSHQNLGHHSLK